MNIKALVGYLLAGVGLVGILISSEKIKVNIPILVDIPSNYILLVAFAILGVGVVFMVLNGRSSSQQSEVPIYKGKEIVGYRRLK